MHRTIFHCLLQIYTLPLIIFKSPAYNKQTWLFSSASFIQADNSQQRWWTYSSTYDMLNRTIRQTVDFSSRRNSLPFPSFSSVRYLFCSSPANLSIDSISAIDHYIAIALYEIHTSIPSLYSASGATCPLRYIFIASRF